MLLNAHKHFTFKLKFADKHGCGLGGFNQIAVRPGAVTQRCWPVTRPCLPLQAPLPVPPLAHPVTAAASSIAKDLHATQHTLSAQLPGAGVTAQLRTQFIPRSRWLPGAHMPALLLAGLVF